MKKIRTRYAPSPTGKLHIGGARTALFSYLYAKHNNGEFLLRIEDTDIERNVKGGEKNQLDGLKWLGIIPDYSFENPDDTGPFRQSVKIDIYNKFIDTLLKEGKAYPCWCTREELEKEREEQLKKGIPSPKYSQKCLHNPVPKDNVEPTIRFKVPKDKIYSWDDKVRGKISVPTKAIGDFVIRKSNGIPTFVFANTIDDFQQKITDVMRGEEHISNTPKQLMIFEALGFEPPHYSHLTIITSTDGKKLSKRDEHVLQFIHMYKERGYIPEAIFNYLVLLGWHPKQGSTQEIFNHQELVKSFDPLGLSKSPAQFDVKKMQWTNNYYIKQLSDKELFNFLNPFIEKSPLTDEKKQLIFKLFQTSILEGVEIREIIKLFDSEVTYKKELIESIKSNKDVIEVTLHELNKLEKFQNENIKQIILNVGTSLDKKGRNLLFPLRVAITGKEKGPEISSIMEIFGKEKTLSRLRNFLKI